MGVLALRKSKGCLQVLSQSLSLLVTLDGSQNLEISIIIKISIIYDLTKRFRVTMTEQHCLNELKQFIITRLVSL